MSRFRWVALLALLVIALLPSPAHVQGATSVDLAVPQAGVCLRMLRDGAAVYYSWATVQNLGDSVVTARVRFWAYLTGPGTRIALYGGSPYIDMNITVPPKSSRHVGRVDTFRFGGTVSSFRQHVQGVDFAAGVSTAPGITDPNPGNNSLRRRLSAYQWCPGANPRVFGVVFRDMNRNGRRDAGEPALPGVIVQLWQKGRLISQVSSGWDGSYTLGSQTEGVYTVVALLTERVRRLLGAPAVWTTPSRYYGISLTGGAKGPYNFGIGTAAATPTPTPTATPRPTPTATPTPTPPPECWPIKEWVEVTPPQADVTYSPRFPVVVGQGGKGFDMNLFARGGRAELRRKEPHKKPLPSGGWEWVCVERLVRREYHKLVSVRVHGALSPASRRWIRTQLATRYYGATIRDPGIQALLFRGRRMVWRGGFHHDAVDPGLYTGEAVFRFQGGRLSPGIKVLVRPFAVPVYMVDTNLER